MSNTHLQVKTPQTNPHHHTIGRFFQAYSWVSDSPAVYYCDSWVENAGYWMTNICLPGDRRNVSERAIGRTYHEFCSMPGNRQYEQAKALWKLNIEPILDKLDPFQGF